MASVYEELNLIIVGDHEASPGENWSEYSAPFSSLEHDKASAILGAVAGTMIAASGVAYLRKSFFEAARKFAEQTKPPIPATHRTSFMSSAVDAGSRIYRGEQV